MSAVGTNPKEDKTIDQLLAETRQERGRLGLFLRVALAGGFLSFWGSIGYNEIFGPEDEAVRTMLAAIAITGIVLVLAGGIVYFWKFRLRDELKEPINRALGEPMGFGYRAVARATEAVVRARDYSLLPHADIEHFEDWWIANDEGRKLEIIDADLQLQGDHRLLRVFKGAVASIETRRLISEPVVIFRKPIPVSRKGRRRGLLSDLTETDPGNSDFARRFTVFAAGGSRG